MADHFQYGALGNSTALNGIAFETSSTAMPGGVHTAFFGDGSPAAIPTPLSQTGTFRLLDGRTNARAGMDAQLGGVARGQDRNQVQIYTPTSATFSNIAQKFETVFYDEDLASEGIAPGVDGRLADGAMLELQLRAAEAVQAAHLHFWERECLTKLWGAAYAFTDGVFDDTEDTSLPAAWNPDTLTFESELFNWPLFFARLFDDMRKKTKGVVQASGPRALKLAITPELALRMQANKFINNIVPAGDITAGFAMVGGNSTTNRSQLIAKLASFDGVGQVQVADMVADTAAHPIDAESINNMVGSAVGLTAMVLDGPGDQAGAVNNGLVTTRSTAMVRTIWKQQMNNLRRNNNDTGWVVSADAWQGFSPVVTSFGQTFFG